VGQLGQRRRTTGPRFLLLVLVLVAGTTAAVLYTNRLYDRKSEELLRAMGRDVEPPPPRPWTSRGASRPSTRPALGNEETAVVRARDGTRIVSVRANGEFFRLPERSGGARAPWCAASSAAQPADMKRAAPAPETLKTLTGVNLRRTRTRFPNAPPWTSFRSNPTPRRPLTAWPRRTTIPDAGGTIDVPLVDADAADSCFPCARVRSCARGRPGWRVERVELLAP
jgi:hypothetical protein